MTECKGLALWKRVWGRRRVGPDTGRIKVGLAAFGLAILVGWAVAGASGEARAEVDGHPDFSGLWMPNGFAERQPDPLPFNDKAQKLHDEYVKEFTKDDDPGRFCIPPGMPRAIWGAPFAIETFHRPQDLTIYFEGYAMYRKIYMEDHDPPEPLLRTRMGHSVAHWEGDTLVVETDHLSAYPYMDDLPNSEEARIVERMRVEEREDENGETRKYLIDEITLTDPKLYTEPIRLHAEAVATPDAQVLEYSCTDTLWEKYLNEQGLELPTFDW